MQKMPDNIGGFSQVEYLSVFVAIIFGVIVTEFFTGWGGLLRNRKQTKFYWLHLSWSVFIFITFIQNWFGIWPRVRYVNVNFLYFIYSLVPLLIFHFMTVTLFPKIRYGQELDIKDFYENNAKVFFILFAVYLSTTILSSLIYDDAGDVLVQNIIRGGGLSFSILCAVFPKKWVLHTVYLLLGYSSLVQFLLVIPR